MNRIEHVPLLSVTICLSRSFVKHFYLVITYKSARQYESGLVDECGPQILRCAQDDTTPTCHPERSEGSLTDFIQKSSLFWPLLLLSHLNAQLVL